MVGAQIRHVVFPLLPLPWLHHLVGAVGAMLDASRAFRPNLVTFLLLFCSVSESTTPRASLCHHLDASGAERGRWVRTFSLLYRHVRTQVSEMGPQPTSRGLWRRRTSMCSLCERENRWLARSPTASWTRPRGYIWPPWVIDRRDFDDQAWPNSRGPGPRKRHPLTSSRSPLWLLGRGPTCVQQHPNRWGTTPSLGPRLVSVVGVARWILDSEHNPSCRSLELVICDLSNAVLHRGGGGVLVLGEQAQKGSRRRRVSRRGSEPWGPGPGEVSNGGKQRWPATDGSRRVQGFLADRHRSPKSSMANDSFWKIT